MAGPWEAFQAPVAALPPSSVPMPGAAPAAEAPAAPAAPAAPWEEMAAAPDQSAGFFGLEPAKDGETLIKNVRELTRMQAPPDMIRKYVTASGGSLPEESEKWLDEVYSKKPGETNFHLDERPETSVGGAAWQGLQSASMSGWDDEWKAGWGTAGNVLGNVLGMNESSASIPEIYAELVKRNREEKDAAYADHPWAYGAGYIPGALINAYVTRGRGAAAETTMGRLAQAGIEGGKQGALVGSGNAESGATNTLLGALEGGALGVPLGVLSEPLSRALSNVAGRIWRGIRPSSGQAEPGLDALSAQAPQSADDIAAMRAEAQRFEEAGVPPRLIDVGDERVRGTVRDAAGKMTPAREEVARHADDVYQSMQDRVADQARAAIDPSTQTARQLERQIRGDKALGGEDEAGVLMGEQMEPLRGRVIQVDDDMKAILSTREGQAALRAAEGLMTDPADREAARKLLGAARAHAKGPPDVDAILRKEVPGWDDMPQPVKDAYLAQRPDLAEVADPFADTPLTLDLADKFARAMRGRAASTPGLERVARDFSNTVRNSARGQVPEYDDALNTYAASQGVADAAGGAPGSRYEDSSFLNTPRDTYAEVVGGASAVPPVEGGISEVQALARRARDEIADRATSGGGAQAAGVARTLARGSSQADRSTALLGPERAGRLQQGMEAELNRVENTRFIDPRTGSQTQLRSQDAIVDGFGEAVANVASGGKWGIIRTAGKWLKQGGIKGVDAERLARDAISEDPSRVRAAIDYLEQKGMKRARAERFVSFYSSALAGRVAGAAVDDGVRAPQPGDIVPSR